ncbi:MAG: integrase core domain-containing protein, partial [Burkholderiaceae bacterium]|nr:integrase core domain-containing protein [Burkholderiaceae bacterium]
VIVVTMRRNARSRSPKYAPDIDGYGSAMAFDVSKQRTGGNCGRSAYRSWRLHFQRQQSLPKSSRPSSSMTPSQRVVDLLTRLISERGAPRILRSDNGPEFVSKKILQWIIDSKIEIAHIDPGKPWQNGTDESFNGRLRDECLSLEWFRTRLEARVIIEQWRRHYNEGAPTRAWTTALPPNSGTITIPFNPEPLSSNSVTEVPGAGQGQ